jgi:hypothetical protein
VDKGDSVLALKGARSLFVIRGGRQYDHAGEEESRVSGEILCGSCTICDFHDGKGVGRAQELGLRNIWLDLRKGEESALQRLRRRARGSAS